MAEEATATFTDIAPPAEPLALLPGKLSSRTTGLPSVLHLSWRAAKGILLPWNSSDLGSEMQIPGIPTATLKNKASVYLRV